MAASDPTTPLSRIPFSPRAEASILALSKWMRIAAVFNLVGGTIRGVAAFAPRHDFGQLIGAVISILMGIWSYQAANAFGQVAKTDTADQRYLMDGFGLLRRVFLLQAIMVIVGLAFLLIAVVVAALFLATRVAR